MGAAIAEAPTFISYSRRDYYFAESLALHLLEAGVAAWLDVHNLEPGVFWERDLFAALDSAACVVLIASADSMRSPNVRQEMERAISQKKRIIVARFRGARLAPELCSCEIVDFRGAFGPALRQLIARIQAPAVSASRPPSWQFPRFPLWVSAMVLFLLIPTATVLGLADWSGASSVVVAAFEISLSVMLVAWVLSLSFLQRKMGMTRLAISLLLLTMILAYPIYRYLRQGDQGLAQQSRVWAQTTEHHLGTMVALAALPLLGLLLVLVFRPYDLLRWEPTGKAWRWYRRHCTAKFFSENDVIATTPADFFLLHDRADVAPAFRVRQTLTSFGWREGSASSSKAVLLLTNRTQTNWLLQQQALLGGDVLTLVGTSICLPAQLDWLWKREWIDLRDWKLNRLRRKEPLPQVPEAVTNPRFPAAVRFANHLLCALAALAFVLFMVANPSLQQQDSSAATMTQEVNAILGMAVVVLAFEMGRRLLRRSITERNFLRGSFVGWGATVVVAAGAVYQGIRQPVWLRAGLPAVFLVAFPIILIRTRPHLTFWFPAQGSKGSSATLAIKRNWRTLLWTFLYLLLWGWMLGITDYQPPASNRPVLSTLRRPTYLARRFIAPADWSAIPR